MQIYNWIEVNSDLKLKFTIKLTNRDSKIPKHGMLYILHTLSVILLQIQEVLIIPSKYILVYKPLISLWRGRWLFISPLAYLKLLNLYYCALFFKLFCYVLFYNTNYPYPVISCPSQSSVHSCSFIFFSVLFFSAQQPNYTMFCSILYYILICSVQLCSIKCCSV